MRASSCMWEDHFPPCKGLQNMRVEPGTEPFVALSMAYAMQTMVLGVKLKEAPFFICGTEIILDF